MKTKTIHHIALLTLLVQTMCMSVLLSHTHMKDVVALSWSEPTRTGSVAMTPLTASDIHSKALGDLHHHIDKTSVKNMSVQTTAARKRKLVPTVSDLKTGSFGQSVYEFMLRFRVVFSLISSARQFA